MEALRVIPPDHYLGVVESMRLVTDLIEELDQRGAIYPVDNGDDAEHPDLYFRQSSDREFGSLGHLDLEAAKALFAERGGDPDRAGKEHPLDCLVWRGARQGEPSWDSPFGAGRPGWHIECTAIALEHLGTDFDVQGGGTDLIFPHHEMCAAQGRVATGKPFARAYVHGGMVGLDGEKMSKSKGNLVLVSKLRESGVDPMAVRLVLLANRYRTEWSWTDDLLTSAQQRLDRWREAAGMDSTPAAGEVIAQIRAALSDDLDAPTALAAVDAWAGAALAGDGDDSEAPGQVSAAVDALLGIQL
jgi:L-cysteine:1D-myo-inositol 2-amino-2-deoxy-alpha-D-glucopyranoside ligase